MHRLATAVGPGRRIPELDGYRGFAALLVLVSHFANRTLVGVDAEGILASGPRSWSATDVQVIVLAAFGNGAGQIGVMIFFALSSFLMFHLYFDTPATNRSLKSFFAGRIARIFPLYYLAVAVSVLATAYLPWTYIAIETGEIFPHLVFADGASVLWTIAPELLFYVVFALTWRLCRGNVYVLLPAVLMVPILSNTIPVVWQSHTAEFFVVGYVVWLYARTGRGREWRGALAMLACAMFALVLGVHLPAVHKPLLGAPATMGWQEWYYPVAIAVLFVLVLDTPWLRAIFSFRPMRFLGEVSFSLYLFHLLILNGLVHYEVVGPNIQSLALTAGLCLTLSSMLYYAFERPTRRWLKAVLGPAGRPDRLSQGSGTPLAIGGRDGAPDSRNTGA